MPRLSRRNLMQGAVGLSAAAAASPVLSKPAPLSGVDLAWLGGAPRRVEGGVVWGAPWPRGALKPSASLRAMSADGEVALQTWPLAYWPDGSLKWTGHAVAGPLTAETVRIEPGKPSKPVAPVTVASTAADITITTGDLVCRLARQGAALIPSVTRGGREELRNGRLVCLRQDRSQAESGVLRTEAFESKVTSATIEQSGPVRALVRLDGMHRGASGREWLPFSVRVAVSAGGGIVLTHTFTFDGEQASDFIAGLGVRFDAPQTDELHNRHVRFSGPGDGLWGEAVRNMPGWQPGKFALANRFADQLEGRPVPSLAEMDAKTRAQLLTVPAWDDFSLFQGDADRFDVRKRTGAVSSWLQAGHGTRSSGLGYLGGPSGGVAFGLRDFWQRHPTELEINGATTDVATITLWLWSPRAQPMDLRHYSGSNQTRFSILAFTQFN